MRDVDETDLTLVHHLLESPRASYAELARVTGLSETTVRRRVESMIDDAVITPAMIPDVRRLGFPTLAILGIKVDLAYIEEAAEAVSRLPEVTSIHMTLGRYDLLATLADRDLESLSNTIVAEISKMPGIRSVETFVSTRALKILRDWRLPLPDGIEKASRGKSDRK